MKHNAGRSYGINMKKYCREHEAYVARAPRDDALLELHLERLRWLQHERLAHLIVLAMTAVAELFFLALSLLNTAAFPLAAVLTLFLAVLLLFYFLHYFFLENTVQRWYLIADALYRDVKALKRVDIPSQDEGRVT